jgi:hypothetical protein
MCAGTTIGSIIGTCRLARFSFFLLKLNTSSNPALVVCAGYLIALIAAGSPYVIAALLAGWVFVAGYSRSSKTWGGLGLIITISVFNLVVCRVSCRVSRVAWRVPWQRVP